MKAKLQFLFFPHESNNYKAKSLHLSSLAFFLCLIGLFQVGLSLLTRIKPGILGYAANISPDRLIELTNERRQEQGLGPLQINNLLVEAASQKASLMFTFGCWAHNCNGQTPWSFFKTVGYDYLYAGENLAKDFGDSESLVSAWTASPSHRDNILNSNYNEIGIAVVDGTLNGEETTLVVQMFGKQARQPAIAYSQTTASLAGESQSIPEVKAGEAIRAEKALTKVEEKRKPVLSALTLTKTFSLTLISLLVLILILDSLLVYQNQIIRISGKSFVHASFFIIILISILLTSPGLIL